MKTSSGEDIIVEATLTNTGSDAINAEVTTFMPGEPRERRTIAGLQSGCSIHPPLVLRDSQTPSPAKRSLSPSTRPPGGRISRTVELP